MGEPVMEIVLEGLAYLLILAQVIINLAGAVVEYLPMVQHAFLIR